MSTLSNNIFAGANGIGVTVAGMSQPRTETIASLIEKVRQRPGHPTYEEIAAASGGRISPNYVHDLAKGAPTKNLGADKIVGLARGLGESPVYIFQLAVGIHSDKKEHSLYQVVDDYADLPKDQQSDLRLMWELLKKEIYERRSRLTRS